MVFENWVISGCVKFRMLDNKTSSFEVVGNIPDGWNWQLLYTCNDNLNIVDMVQNDGTLSVLFTKEMLPLEGTYYFQLKATKGELIKHTNIVKSYVNKSLSGDVQWPVVPSEFTDIENAVKGYAESAQESAEKAENAAVHSPIIGNNGNWWVWNFDTSEYIDTGVSASGGGGSDRSLGISNASVGDIALVDEVSNIGVPTKWKSSKNFVSSVNGETGDVQISGGDISLGVTGAAVGDIIKVAAVDADGKPTAWEAADMPSGGGVSFSFDLIVDHTVIAEDLSVMKLTWTSEAIPNLGKYNLFYAVIESDVEFGLTRWVHFYINNFSAAQFAGDATPKCKKIPVACNRYFGNWLGTRVYSPVNSVPFPVLTGACENTYQGAGWIKTAEDATSIAIGSYAADFGLAEGMSIKVYATV